MPPTIHVRLDSETDELRQELKMQLGWTDAQIVREGIKMLSRLMCRGGRTQIIGLGEFKSGIVDLGSSEEHLKEFGD